MRLLDAIRPDPGDENVPPPPTPEPLQKLRLDFALKGPGDYDSMPKLGQEIVDRVRKRYQGMEKLHKQYRERWDHNYGLWRNYDNLRSDYSAARQAEGDRAGRAVILNAQQDWGSYLFIPYVYATIETVVPRIVTNPPKWNARPRRSRDEEGALIKQSLVNQEQQNINYELVLQPTARRGLKYGLGIQKTFWERKVRKQLRNVPSRRQGYQTVEQDVELREGPMAEDHDIYDFFWDEAAKSIETCDDAIFRYWRTFRYIKQKVDSGEWFKVDLEAVKGMGRATKRDEVWEARMRAQGLSKPDSKSDDRLHEVLEYHDGQHVYTVIDDTLLVEADKTPFYHRCIPGQAYRPTMVEGEFVGMDEITPIEDLQKELNTMRSQRRDNAAFVLNRAYAYAEGFVNRKNMKVGPGMAIPTQGDPREAIFPLPVEDIPASGYGEENALKRDIELTSGISEATAGGVGDGQTAGTETATGIQLIQAAANVRIAMKSKMLVLETCTPAVRQWDDLYQQHVLENFERRIDDRSSPKGYYFIEVTPEDLAAEVDWIAEDNSTEPENKPQKLNDALTLYQQVASSPIADQAQNLKHLLTAFDVRDPDAWISEQQDVSPEALGQVVMAALVSNFGVPEDQAQEMVLTMVEEAKSVEADQAQAGDQPPQEGSADGPPQP